MIKTTMECKDVSDPTKPGPRKVHMEFDPEAPLEVKFVFENTPDDHAIWLLARQLVVDGLHAPLLTGYGDVKCRSTERDFMLQLHGADGYIYTTICPREQVLWVADEAERECPLDSVTMMISDECIADWLAEA